MSPTRDTGASVVEYGLLVCGVVIAFLVAFAGLQLVFSAIFGRAVSSVERVDPAKSSQLTPLRTPLGPPSSASP